MKEYHVSISVYEDGQSINENASAYEGFEKFEKVLAKIVSTLPRDHDRLPARRTPEQEAKRLISDLENAFNRLRMFERQTGFPLFGLADVEEGLRYLKGEKSE